MKLYYFEAPDGNVGDDLNPWLWNRIFPNQFDEDDGDLFVGIGTLLNGHLVPGAKRTIIFGSGVGYGRPPLHIYDKWDIFFVRGPLSAQMLSIPEVKAIADPALLVSDFFRHKPPRNGIGLIPHFESLLSFPLESVCKEAGLTLISPKSSVEDFANAIP